MAIRGFKGIQAIGAASQPVFGTTMNGTGILTPDPYTQSTSPASQESLSTIPVTVVTGWRIGDRIAIGPKANFVFKGSLDFGFIQKIATGAGVTGTLTVQGLLNAHASGEYVVLAEDVAFVQVIPVVTAGILYLGTAETVSSSDASTFDQIPIYGGTGNLTYWHQSPTTGRANSYNTSEYWIEGTQNDTFLARFSQV